MKLRIIVSILTVLSLFFITACKEEGPAPQPPRTRTEYIHVGPNWASLHNLKASEKTFNVSVMGKETYKKGESIVLTVTSSKAGKLWVVQVDPQDRVTMLFPNDRSPDNQIKANTPVSIPPEGATWEVEAGEPLGKSAMAFIVTTGNTDLSHVLGAQKSMPKALNLVEAAPSWGIGKMVIDVK